MITDELDDLLTPVIQSIPKLRESWEEQKAQQSNQKMNENASIIEIPPDCFFIEIPRKAYCWIVEKIPEGCVSSEESILEFFKSCLELKEPGCTEGAALAIESEKAFEEYGAKFPSWRLVSRYGLLRRTSDGLYPDEMKLHQEGLETESCGAGGKSRRVLDYKKHMADWSELLK